MTTFRRILTSVAIATTTALSVPQAAAIDPLQSSSYAVEKATADATRFINSFLPGAAPKKSAPKPAAKRPTAPSKGSRYDGSRRDPIMRQLHAGASLGDSITIRGQKARVCIFGDGYGLSMIAAGPNTSCGFSKAVMSKQIKGLNPTDDNVRNSLKPVVRATSPATGKTYTMKCGKNGRLITCKGGNNATVYMY